MKSIFKINIFTYLFFLLSILAGYYKDIIIIYFILIFHEIGHYIIMRYYKINIYNITIYPYGGMIKSNILINTNSKKVLLISIGGILFQITLMLIFNLLKNTISYELYCLFIKYNIYIIIFNLLPIYPLDGYKILNSFIELFFSYKKSLYISFFINIIFLVFFYIYLYIYNIHNYLIIIFMLINLINYIKEIKYIMNKFFIERYIYNIEYEGLISIKKMNNMYKNRFNYINGIDEKSMLINRFKSS